MARLCDIRHDILKFFVAQCTLVKCNAFWYKVTNSRICTPFYIFFLNPVYVAALCSDN